MGPRRIRSRDPATGETAETGMAEEIRRLQRFDQEWGAHGEHGGSYGIPQTDEETEKAEEIQKVLGPEALTAMYFNILDSKDSPNKDALKADFLRKVNYISQKLISIVTKIIDTQMKLLPVGEKGFGVSLKVTKIVLRVVSAIVARILGFVAGIVIAAGIKSVKAALIETISGALAATGIGAPFAVLLQPFVIISDRNSKDIERRLSRRDRGRILQGIRKLPVYRYRYKGSNRVRHGTMAQDFHKAFGFTGASEETIDMQDQLSILWTAVQYLLNDHYRRSSRRNSPMQSSDSVHSSPRRRGVRGTDRDAPVVLAAPSKSRHHHRRHDRTFEK